MDCFWEADGKLPQFPALEEDLYTDVLIVGGGLAGLLCAWRLSQSGANCVLIEENRLLQGVSGRTTAKVTAQHGLIYHKLLKTYGAQAAKAYFDANTAGLTGLAALGGQFDCDLEEENSYLYATGSPEELEAEMEAYLRLGIPARWQRELPLPIPVTGVICLEHQYQLHPLKLAAHIAKDLKIFENTKALAFHGNRVLTPKGVITAEKIIIATHFPILNKHGAYFLKLYQQRSYVIALENAPQVEGMYLDCAENGLSLRQAGKYLLLGGGGHRTGKSGLGWSLPEAAAKKYFPQALIAARWATQDCMTLDGIPYIGLYSPATPNLFVATGFQKWGLTTSMVAATVLGDLVQGKENPYAYLFSPRRSIFHKQLLVNGAETIWNLLRPTAPRCPHLGCALHWNKLERSWDCPCHGSRFDETGRRLNNPATADLKRNP